MKEALERDIGTHDEAENHALVPIRLYTSLLVKAESDRIDENKKQIEEGFLKLDAQVVELRKEQRGELVILENRFTERMASALKAEQEKVAIASEATKAAMTKADAAIEKRFDAVNEFRGQSLDRERSYLEQAKAYISRTESAALIKSIENTADDLKVRLAAIEGRGSGMSALFGYAVAAIMAIGVVIDLIVHR